MGPLARYAEDLILALKVMAGPMAATLKLDRRVNEIMFYFKNRILSILLRRR